METFFLYIIKSGICFSLLYVGFICLMKNTTCFHFNRMAILCGCLACILLPFVQLELNKEIFAWEANEVTYPMAVAQNNLEKVQKEWVNDSSSINKISPLIRIAGICYVIICSVIFLITVLSHFRIRSIIRHSQYLTYKSYKLYISSEQKEAFSFGKYIVIPKELYDDKEHLNGVLCHELSHLHNLHSIDILFMQLIIIVHWFNPFIWLLRQELLDIHEYQADNDVINQGINATQYQLLLVKKAVGSRLYNLTNGFNNSKLKKRIKMMLKKRTKRMVQLRVLLFVPLVAGVIYSFATTAPLNVKQDSQWSYPVPGSTLNGSYGGQRKHLGIDLKANKDSKIMAAFDGVVVTSDSNRAYGKVVVIRHDNGLETLYAHNSENLVKKGEKVKAGQVIASVGNSGRSTSFHCHFEIKKDGHLIDPETIFDTKTQELRADRP